MLEYPIVFEIAAAEAIELRKPKDIEASRSPPKQKKKAALLALARHSENSSFLQHP